MSAFFYSRILTFLSPINTIPMSLTLYNIRSYSNLETHTNIAVTNFHGINEFNNSSTNFTFMENILINGISQTQIENMG